MARPRTATNILDARGAFRQNPQRKRDGEPKPKSAFRKSAPAHLTPEQKAVWKEIVKQIPAGVLTGSDHAVVEIVVVLYALFRELGAAMPAAQLTRMASLMGRLGLDPSGRASLVVPKEKDTGFDDV